MAKFCPKCGYKNDDETQTCMSCGASLVDSQNVPAESTENNKQYLQALIQLRYYTIIGFISLVVGIVINYVLLRSFSYGYLIGPLGTAFGGVSLGANNVSGLVAYAEIALTISAIITLFGLYMLYRGFSTLKLLSPEFSLGKTGTVLEMVGMVLVVLGTIGLLATILPLVNLGNSSASTSLVQSQIGALLGLAALVLIAGIILLIGVIMALIGIFRVGSRYDNTVVKVGAILTLFLGIIGTILLYIGFTDIINKLKRNIEQAGSSD